MYDGSVRRPSLVEKVLGIGITEEIDGPESRRENIHFTGLPLREVWE